jgi:hypothetical protein
MDIFIVEHNISREYFNIHVEFFFLLMDGQFELFFPFKSLVVTSAPHLQASLMDIHHDTSLRFILEDDSISLELAFVFVQGKGQGCG